MKTTHCTAHIVLFSFHMCRALFKKTLHPVLKQYLCQLVSEQSVATFYQIQRIMSVCDRPISTYLNRNWMKQKRNWAAAFNGEISTLGNNTNNRVESSHKQLKRKLCHIDSLCECL